MNNLWPDIEEFRTTDDVLPFLNETIESLKTNYNGRLNAQLTQIRFDFLNMRKTMQNYVNKSSVVSSPANKKDSNKDIEKNRQSAQIESSNYQYDIFNDHLYYKLFFINIPEFYPITLQVSDGIFGEESKKIEVNGLAELKKVFSNIVCSMHVRMVIKKMIR